MHHLQKSISKIRISARLILFCLFIICCTVNVDAQHYSWEDFVEKLSVDEYADNEYLTPLIEDLSEIHAHPFNINTVTKQELEQLPFLSSEDIEEILA